MKRDLRGQVIVITGASSGIGAATAVACAEAGMDVVLNARRVERLEEVASRVRETGRRAVTVVGDVLEPGITERMLDAATEELGRLDAVFANAGYGMQRAMVEMSSTELRRMFDVNFFASVDLVRAAATRLREADRPGHLLMCSSCLAKFPLACFAAYSASKSAQNHVCRAMRIELRPHGIEVSSVHPVTTTTEFFEVSAQLTGRDTGGKAVPDHAPSMFVQPPERVARAIVACLRRPRPEVWTSLIVRTVAGLVNVWPPLMDWVIAREKA